jgi:hypothetical protein
MKRFSYTTALKAVLVGVVISGMATACQNGDSTIGGFLPKEEQAATGAKTSSAATQSDEERKAEQARKIAEFLAKPEVKEMSAGLEEIAQAVAVAVEDKALTERIYEKCMEKFDGETNTLWMHLEADSKMKSQGGWNKRVDAELSKGRKNATVKGIGNIDAAVKKFEKTVGAPLHLFWMYPSGWDKKTTPLVAFVPFDVNPKTRTSIPAFDAKGNSFELSKDGALAKQRPIIVININERTSVQGQVKNVFVAKSSESGSVSLQPISPTETQNKGKNGAATQSATSFSMTLTSVWFASSLALDELSWDGASEFFCVGAQNTQISHPTVGFTTSAREVGWAYMGNLATGVTHTRNDAIGSGTIGYYSGGYAEPSGFVHWWEDDFVYGADPFDDDLGVHMPLNFPLQIGGLLNTGVLINRTFSGIPINTVLASYRITTN